MSKNNDASWKSRVPETLVGRRPFTTSAYEGQFASKSHQSVGLICTGTDGTRGLAVGDGGVGDGGVGDGGVGDVGTDEKSGDGGKG